jgi:SPP1 family predicted phage head-tail adaptor
MTYDRPITIQKIDEMTELWTDLWHLHARVNKTQGSEFVEAGAEQSQSTKTFEVRYFSGLEDVDYNRGLYRLVYKGHTFNIVDYDDFMESHQVVKLKAVSYGD